MPRTDNRHLSVRAIIVFYREFERVTRDADISIGQYRTLLYLKGGAKRAGEIAAAGAVKKPTISAMLANLRDKGWIADEADPADGRAVSVALTPAGRARIDALEETLADRVSAIVPPAELADLLAALSTAYLALRSSQDDRIRDIENQFIG
ncbi:MAG: MarR family transcriptional regulator [Parvibaculum sp.]|uniref:MarR family winged helix-turn-helix transcriptional regulator n=1 Tax=Parvibaculum sp. TaxID=2024848 RepID=UPI0028470A06|nr:MarR family transcriptional regulator [Parvibaculum sp.]MDR3500239.1 MarR family transcriptional regulator [Parvibaculum sp.]